MKSIFKKDHRFILLYNSNTQFGKRCVFEAKSIDSEVYNIDLNQAKIGMMDWLKIADLLGIKTEELINKNHADFKQLYQDSDIDLEAYDAAKILHKQPQNLKYPVAIKNKKALFIRSLKDLLTL